MIDPAMLAIAIVNEGMLGEEVATRRDKRKTMEEEEEEEERKDLFWLYLAGKGMPTAQGRRWANWNRMGEGKGRKGGGVEWIGGTRPGLRVEKCVGPDSSQ
jgi:hypothetical protein